MCCKRWIQSGIIAVCLALSSLAVAQDETTLNVGDWSVTVPSAWAEDARIEARDAEMSQVIRIGMLPTRIRAWLIGLDRMMNSDTDAEIYFYDGSGFEPGSPYQGDWEAIRAFFADEPSPDEIGGGATIGGKDIPFPGQCDAPLFIVQPRYFDFEGGRGIRFLTNCAPVFPDRGTVYFPTTNEDLTYTFIGLGENGQILSMEFPIRTDVLPDEIDYDNFDLNAYQNDYRRYVADEIRLLEGLDANAFTPSVDVYDGMIASLRLTAQTAFPDDAGRVVFDAVSWVLPPEVGSHVHVTTVDPIRVGEAGAMDQTTGGGEGSHGFSDATLSGTPGYRLARFVAYPIEHAYPDAELRFWEMTSFAEARYYAGERELLERLLARVQAEGEAMPFLPISDWVGRASPAQIETLTWAGGRGVRYITRHFQGGASPTTNERLFYAFLGQSEGGQVISGTFPVEAEALAREVFSGIFPANYNEQLDAATTLLDGLNAADFTPSLDVLDGMIETLITQ